MVRPEEYLGQNWKGQRLAREWLKRGEKEALKKMLRECHWPEGRYVANGFLRKWEPPCQAVLDAFDRALEGSDEELIELAGGVHFNCRPPAGSDVL